MEMKGLKNTYPRTQLSARSISMNSTFILPCNLCQNSLSSFDQWEGRWASKVEPGPPMRKDSPPNVSLAEKLVFAQLLAVAVLLLLLLLLLLLRLFLRVFAQSCFPTTTLGFLLPWISSWFFVGFLLSSPPYVQSFLRKRSFLVLADFFPLVFKSKQLLGFLGVVYMLN
jgi:hypothetical protein